MAKQAEIKGLKEIERSEGYLIKRRYHSVVLYREVTDDYNKGYLLVEFESAWNHTKEHWRVIFRRAYTLGHYARKAFKKRRFALAKMEMGL